MADVLTAQTVTSDRVEAPATGARLWRYDLVAVGILLGLFPVVHDVMGMLRASYFLDEAWVAMSVRFPLSDLPLLTASSPLGWSFLVHLVPDGDYLRVVPMIFHLLTIASAYALGRQLSGRKTSHSFLYGIVCGAAMLLLPVQQVRHDLKQYTADATITLLLLALTAWVEAGWSRRRLGVLVAVVPVGMLVSHAAAIAAVCVFGGIVLAAAARRQWRRLVEGIVAGLAAGAAIGVILVSTSLRGRNEHMQNFWVDYFPTVTELPSYLAHRAAGLFPLLGIQSTLLIYLLLGCFVAGVLTMARLGRVSLAVAATLMPLVAVVLGVARKYPLLDLRTSHYLLVEIGAVAALGIAGAAVAAATLASRLVRRGQPTIVAATICAVVVAGYALSNSHWYRFDGQEPGVDHFTPMAVQDIRSAVRHVEAHRSPNDVIVVNGTGGYGFAFYWRQDKFQLVVPYANAVGWHVRYPNQPSIVSLDGWAADHLRRGLKQATDLAAQRGTDARVWLIRSHVLPYEKAAWDEVLVDYNVQFVTGGPEPVALISRK